MTRGTAPGARSQGKLDYDIVDTTWLLDLDGVAVRAGNEIPATGKWILTRGRWHTGFVDALGTRCGTGRGEGRAVAGPARHQPDRSYC